MAEPVTISIWTATLGDGRVWYWPFVRGELQPDLLGAVSSTWHLIQLDPSEWDVIRVVGTKRGQVYEVPSD